VNTYIDSMSMHLLEGLMGQDEGLLSPLLILVSGACLILGTCFLPVLRVRRDDHHALGPRCRPDEPLEGSEWQAFCIVA